MQQLEVVDGSYRTAARRVSLVARLAPSCAFHIKFLTIVVRSALLAQRGKYDHGQWAKSSQQVLRALESVGVEFDISGLENLAKGDGACVVVGNHMSTLETMVLPGLIEPIRRHTFVVKRSLLDYPFFKHVMRSRDPVAVSQQDPREDLKAMLAGGTERLKKGVSLVVFPQSRRTRDFDPDEFNSIGVKLASRANVPIVPLALETAAWGLGRIIIEFGRIDPTKKVHFAFGEPMHVTERGAAQQSELIDFIQSKLQQWRA